jgi:hypothetical protein
MITITSMSMMEAYPLLNSIPIYTRIPVWNMAIITCPISITGIYMAAKH